MPIKGFKINRQPKKKGKRIEDLFPGLSKLPAVKRIFPSKKLREKVFKEVVVKVTPRECLYMRVLHGRLLINPKHLRTEKREVLYLDLIHELVHVGQMFKGKNLYDERYNYFDRPTEVEAYKFCIEEAKKIGMNKKEIVDYLKVEWADDKEVEEFLKFKTKL